MIPQLSDEAIDKLGALIVHADRLVDEVFYQKLILVEAGQRPSQQLERAIKDVREDLSDHRIMALKLVLDREGRLPK